MATQNSVVIRPFVELRGMVYTGGLQITETRFVEGVACAGQSLNRLKSGPSKSEVRLHTVAEARLRANQFRSRGYTATVQACRVCR